MAHKFDHSKTDPYVEAAHQIEEHLFSSRGGVDAGAAEELYGSLSDSIVTAIGDIAAQAFRLGVNQPKQLRGLAKAIAASAETVVMSYQGEVDPSPALQAIAGDPRVESLTAENRQELSRQLEMTGQLERLVLGARRLPDLIDFAGSLGVEIHEDVLDQGTLLVSAPHTPTPKSAG